MQRYLLIQNTITYQLYLQIQKKTKIVNSLQIIYNSFKVFPASNILKLALTER